MNKKVEVFGTVKTSGDVELNEIIQAAVEIVLDDSELLRVPLTEDEAAVFGQHLYKRVRIVIELLPDEEDDG